MKNQIALLLGCLIAALLATPAAAQQPGQLVSIGAILQEINAGDLDVAYNNLNYALSLQPGNPVIYYLLAVDADTSYAKTNNQSELDAASHDIQMAFTICPTGNFAPDGMATGLFRRIQLEEAGLQ